MVFENWVRGKLHELLGHYVEIDHDALKIGVWNGHLVLDNLRLLPGPIPGSPFCVVSGSLRRLELMVPWKNLKRKPVIMHIEELEVLYGPRGPITQEERQSEAAKALQRKRELLQSLDGDGEPDTSDGSALAEDELTTQVETEDSSFLERLSGQIMRNVEIKIDTVRMVYRDSSSLPMHPFELVATIGSLGIQSCDSSWTPAVLAEDDRERLFRKLVTLSDLSISFECAGLREELLRPVTAELKMEHVVGSARRPPGVAQHTLCFSLDRVELQFSKVALVCCVAVAQKSDLRAYLAYAQYRPAERPCKATARDWWQYARRGVTYTPEARNKAMAQKRWTDLSWQVGGRAEYLRLYKATRRRPVAGLNVQPKPASAEEKATLQALDERFDTRAIALFRRVAMAELKIERATTKEALRSYKRVKEDAMGSSLSRMKMKATMSKTEYAALKPFKPTEMMETTREQRRSIFEELGVGKGAEDAGADEQPEQIDIRVAVGTSALVLNETLHVDGKEPLLQQLVFRIGTTNLRLRVRSVSQRIECHVASIVLFDLTDSRNIDIGGWHDGKALSIQPGAETAHAVTLLVDTAGTGGQGEVECSVGPVSIIYSRAAHSFLLGIIDEFYSQAWERESGGFVSKAKSRVGLFSDRAKRQLKSRLHRTHSKRFIVSVVAIVVTLPLHVHDDTSPAIRLRVQDLQARSKQHDEVPAESTPAPAAPAIRLEGGTLVRSDSLSQGSLDSDLFDRLYLRVDIGCQRLRASMLTERGGPEQDVVPICHVKTEIAIMLVNEIQIDGESLTAALPWYEVAIGIDGLDIRLTADQLLIAAAIVQTIYSRSTTPKSASGLLRSGADAVWPMHTRLKLSLGDVAAEIKTEEAVIAGKTENVKLVYTLDCAHQSWTTVELRSLAVCCRSDQDVVHNLVSTTADSGVAISAILSCSYGSRKDFCDVSLAVAVRSTITVGVPQGSVMRSFVPGLRELSKLVELPPSPVIVSPRQTEVPCGARKLELSVHCLRVELPTVHSATQHLLVLTVNLVEIAQHSFEQAVSYQCTCASVDVHTDVELECSIVAQENVFFRCSHRNDGAPGLSLEVKSVFSEEHAMFVVRNVVIRFNHAYLIASNAVQACAMDYMATWKEVLGIEADKWAAVSVSEEADAAADLVRNAMAQRLEKLSQRGSTTDMTLTPSGPETIQIVETANLDMQIDGAKVVVPSMQLGEGLKFVASVRLTNPGGMNPQTHLELSSVQLNMLRSLSGACVETTVLRQPVSISITASVSAPMPAEIAHKTSLLKQGKLTCSVSAISCELSQNAIATFRSTGASLQQSPVVAQMLQEKKTEWRIKIGCPSVSLAYLSKLNADFISVDIIDMRAQSDLRQAGVQVENLRAACMMDGRAVDIFQLERTTSGVCAMEFNFNRYGQRQLAVHLGDLQFVISPEIARALVGEQQLHRPSFDEDSFLIGLEHTPSGSDFVLTENDVMMCDMALSPNERLFVTGQPGMILKLHGNGHSLRFDGAGKSLLVFVAPGTTLFLDDMVVENWNQERVDLGMGSKIVGVVEIADERTIPIPHSPRPIPAGLMSKMRSISKPTESLVEDSFSSTGEHGPSVSLGKNQGSIPVAITVASCRMRFDAPLPLRTGLAKASDSSSDRTVHQRARSEDFGRMTHAGTVRPFNDSANAADRRHRRTLSLESKRSYSVDAAARITFNFTPTGPSGQPTARLVVDDFVTSVSSIIEGKRVVSTKINKPLTVVLEAAVEESGLSCELEIVGGLLVQVSSDTVSRIGYVLLCARDAWEEIGTHKVPGSAAAVGVLKEYRLSIASATVSSIVVELVDPSGVSFSRCCLLECFLQVSCGRVSRDVFLRAEVSTDYYNGTASDWEPFLESWNLFAVGKHTDDSTAERSEIDFNVRSSNGISVNITQHLLAAYGRVFLPWVRSIRMQNPDALEVLSAEPSFTVRNDTRQQICIRLPTSDGITEYDMAPSEMIQYDGAFLTEHGARAANRVQIEIEGCCGSIGLDRVGISHLLLDSPDKSRQVHIGVHVMQTQQTAKRVYIRSELFIQNQTAIPLGLQLGWKADSPVVHIKPYSYATCALQDVMSIAPCDGAGRATHEWMRVHDTQAGREYNGVVTGRVQLIRCAALSSCDDGGAEPEPESGSEQPVSGGHSGIDETGNKIAVSGTIPSLRPASVHMEAVHHEVNLLWHCEDGNTDGGPSSFRIQYPVTIQNRLSCKVQCRFMLKHDDPAELYRIEHLPGCVLEAGADADLEYGPKVLMQLLVDHFELSLDTVIDEPQQIRIRDHLGQTLTIEMDSHATEEGRTVVTLYASTWIVNYTGLPLRYWRSSPKGACAIPGIPPEGIISQKPVLCDAEIIQLSIVGEVNMFALHPDDTALSKPFNLTSVGTTGAVAIEDLPRSDGIPQHRYDLVVANRLGKGKYRRTRIVAISAQYQLLNHLDQPLFYIQADKQALRAAAGGLAVPPHVSTPVYFRNTHGKPYLYLRADSASHDRWSAAVTLDGAYNLALAIPAGSGDAATESGTREALVRLDCQVPGASGSQVLLVRPFERERTGYLVENNTPFKLMLWQHGLRVKTGQRLRTLQVEPHRAEPFVWEQPLTKQIVKLELSGRASAVAVDSNGTAQMPLQFQILASFDNFTEEDSVYWAPANVHVVVRVRVRGSTKVLRISTLPGVLKTPADVHVAPSTMLSTTQCVARESKASGTDASEQEDLPRQQSKFNRRSRPVVVSFELVLSYLQLAVIDRSPGPREIFALCVSELKLQSDVILGTDMKVDASIAAFQIEDSSPRARFPVVFGAKNTASTTPFLQFSLIKSLEDASSHSYPFFSILMQTACLTLEDTFLSKAVRFFSDESVLFGKRRTVADEQSVRPDSPSRTSSFEAVDREVATWDADGSMDKFCTAATEPHDVKAMYCKLLQLHPVQINVTFVTTGVAFQGTPVIVPFLSDVEDAWLRLDALVLENTHTTLPRIAQAVAARYRQQLTYAFYKMIGTADLLGNPIGLIDSLATGVFALFYEPAAAVFKHPTDVTIEDLAGGLAKGMGALIHSSIHAPMNSVSKVTGTVSRSVAMLSFDEDYLHSRSNSSRRANMRSGHLGHGLRAGAEGLAKGIGMGLGGLVTAPAQAVRKDGIWGLGAGFAKGLTGAVVKPTVGAIDMAEGLTTGIRNTATIINTAAGRGPEERRRLRAPRAPIGEDDECAALTAYDAALARGFAALRSSERVVAYVRRGKRSFRATSGSDTVAGVTDEGGVVILTDTRLLLLDDEVGVLSAAASTVEVDLASINSVAKNVPSATAQCGLLVRTKPVPMAWIDQWRGSSFAATVVKDDPQGAVILVKLNEDDVDDFTALVSMQVAKIAR